MRPTETEGSGICGIRHVGMQNGDTEKARTAADRDDEAPNSDGAVEEAAGDRDDETSSRDGTDDETSADPENDEPNRGAESTVAERDDEDPSRDTEQAAAVADREDRDRKEARKSVLKKGDGVWTMYLPSTSGKESFAVPNNNYGCEHYKRKSKFVVGSKMISCFVTVKSIRYFQVNL